MALYNANETGSELFNFGQTLIPMSQEERLNTLRQFVIDRDFDCALTVERENGRIYYRCVPINGTMCECFRPGQPYGADTCRTCREKIINMIWYKLTHVLRHTRDPAINPTVVEHSFLFHVRE